MINPVLFLLLVIGMQWFPVSADQGGNVSMSYYCKNPGCAADVTEVFCHDDDPVFDNGPIPDCAGHLPAPNSVCQHHDRAFVTTDRAEQCDFEGKEGHIDSEECTVNSVICNITNDTTEEVGSITEEEGSTERQRTVLIVLAILFCLGLLFLCVRFCKRRQNREQNQQDGRASGAAQHLMEMQSPGTASERDTPGLDDGGSPTQRHRGP